MTRTRYVVLGDTHADFLWTLKVLDHAKDLKVSTIFQVGDWGFLWPDENGKTGDQVEALADALRARQQRMFFIDGNHDWHPELRRRDWPAELHYCRRGTSWIFVNDDGRDVVVGFLGGAPSIDVAMRVEGIDWWPEEEIRYEELPFGELDVLFTHDAPERPWNKAEMELPMSIVYRCRASHEKIQQAIRATQPRLLYHGHYHWPYTGNFEGTEVRGLGCNRQTGAYVVLNHNFEVTKDRITGWVTK